MADVASFSLITCGADWRVHAAIGLAQEKQLNNLPVERNGEIVGVLENLLGEQSESPPPNGALTADAAKQALDPRMLVEAREPLASFVPALAVRPYYLVLQERRVSGIVTPSDGNKLPVRVVAYTMVAYLESLALEAARRIAGSDEAAIAALGVDSEAQIRGNYARFHRGRLEINLLDATSFRQKGHILAALNAFDDPGSSQAPVRRPV